MSKGNLFLGFGRGKVGDVVFSRQNGEQVTRARNRSPRNPRSPLQLLQRVVMKTSSAGYSLMQDICNHSFQGFAEGSECQSEFLRRNVEIFRLLLADEINSGDPMAILTSAKTNFAMRNQSTCPINPYLVSDGSIQPLPMLAVASGTGLDASTQWRIGCKLVNPLDEAVTAETLTYQNVVDCLGLQKGDQLTVIYGTVDDTEGQVEPSVFNGFIFGRIILEPNDGNMSSTFFGTVDDSGNRPINKPNERNDFDGHVSLNLTQGEFLFELTGGVRANKATNSYAAGTVIVSRETGGVWLRSRNQLIVRPSDPTVDGHLDFDAETLFLGDAIQSYQTEAGSLLYLNQSQG